MTYNDDGNFANRGNTFTTYPSTTWQQETEVEVIETFYDEQGRVVKEVITRTTKRPYNATPYQPYTINVSS